MGKIFNLYLTSSLYLGYVTVVNSKDFRHSYVEDTVIALRKVKDKNKYKYEPVLSKYSYYSLNKVFKLTDKVNVKGMFIKPEELKAIVDSESEKYRLTKKNNQGGFDYLNDEKIKFINNELDINKRLEKRVS